MSRALVLGLLGYCLGGCLDAGLTPCGDVQCPPGDICGPNGACVDPERLCSEPGAACTFAGSSGLCIDGVCNAALCGDGEVVAPEQCDGDDNNGATCLTYGFYEPGGLACGPDCKADTSSCIGRCGDGELNGPELCDTVVGANISTCFEVGFDYGSVSCSSALCAPLYDECTRLGWTQYPHTMDYPQIYATPRLGITYFSDAGRLLRVTSAADETIDLPAECAPQAIWASPNDVVFVANQTHVCRRDGTTFTQWSVAGSDHLWGTSATDVYAAGATLQHFDGTTWSTVATGAPSAFTGLHGRGTTIAGTTQTGVAIFDGAWSHVAPPAANPTQPWVSASGKVYVRANSRIYRRDGASWTMVTPFAIENYWGVGETLYAYGSGVMRAQLGAAWLEIDTPLALTGFSIIGGGPDHLLMVGIYAAFYESRGLSWTPAFDVPNFALWGFSSSNIIALSGAFASRFDGTAWTSMPAPPAAPRAVWGFGGNKLIAIGDQDGFHFDGVSWSSKPLGTANTEAVWGESPTRVFATGNVAGGGGRVVMFDGTSWTPVLSRPGGAGGGFGTATAGSYAIIDAKIYHLPPGAAPTAWVPIEPPDPSPLVGVWTDDDEMVVTLFNRRAYRYRQGAWSPVPTRLSSAPRGLIGPANNAFGVTGNELVRYDGTTFDRVRLPSDFVGGAAAVFASDELVVLGAGNKLTILVRP